MDNNEDDIMIKPRKRNMILENSDEEDYF